MSIYIHNSLTRKKEEFLPLHPPEVNIYTCGVTVYDESHIGHARSLYIFDLIRKYLVYRGYKVRFVRNITDIDDKIINRANELKVGWKQLVDKYIASYYEDLKNLGLSKADSEPKATENIPEMIRYIQALVEKGFAYEAEGDVYFNVRKFGPYGKLSGQNVEQMEAGARVAPGEQKKDPLDFALWKKAKPNEPSWDSPWGQGRPGWHIECSVMSQKLLKTDTLDIHAGGRDLIFPHHENEIAQSEALTDKPFAKYWIHHGLLTINSQKMAKSSGNFITIKGFLEKYRDADILKMFFLSAHYSHPIDYSDSKIEETKQALERLHILNDKLSGLKSGNAVKANEIDLLKENFFAAMDDDFNTPQALAAVFDLVNLANKNLENEGFALYAKQALRELLALLGISLSSQSGANAMTDESVEKAIEERRLARLHKDYALGDRIRKDLEDKGIILEDGKGRTTWRRKI